MQKAMKTDWGMVLAVYCQHTNRRCKEAAGFSETSVTTYRASNIIHKNTFLISNPAKHRN